MNHTDIILLVLLSFVGMEFLVSFINLVSRLQLPKSSKQHDKKISILIPARNEEQNIGNLLNDIINLCYSNFEVIVLNDNSEDNTAEVVQKYISQDSRIKLINSNKLPKDWLGKNYACNELSNNATGDYFLFIDADVRISGDILERAAAYLERFNLSLLSIFPLQKMETIGEKIVVPIMNMVLLSLLPLILVRKSKFRSLSAANGQFMMFRSDLYNKLKPHQIFRKSKTEDIDITKFYKRMRYKTSCMLGDEGISCRMYNGLNDSIEGFSKNIIAFFSNSILFAMTYWIINTYSALIAFISGKTELALYIVIIQILTMIFISIKSKQSILSNIFLMPIRLFIFLFIIIKSIYYAITKGYKWKGRLLS